MKIIRAEFKNFRLLKDLVLDFSTDDEKTLTVIRAANETGKTTCEYGLMWALYGSKGALPNKGDYPLFPADLKSKGEKKVDVSVSVEFTVEQVRRAGRRGGDVESVKYRLVRSCVEYSDREGKDRRQSESVRMFKVTNAGTEPIPEGEVKRIIDNALPISLRDVYFTDGDSAMSFIEAAATTGVKRKRVSNAIESLLGLEILKSTVRHLENVSNKFSQEIDNTDYAKELEKLNDRIEGWSEDLEGWEKDRVELESQQASGRRELKQINSGIEEALKLGDKAKLAGEIRSVKSQLDRIEKNEEIELKQLADLLSSEELSRVYMRNVAQKAQNTLDQLNKKKQLPKVNIPILEELLDAKVCFCGADLSKNTDEGKAAREKINESIEESRESDAVQEVASSLFYRIRSIDYEAGGEKWVDNYSNRSSAYQNTLSTQQELEVRLKELNADVDSIDDSCLEELREQKSSLEVKLFQITNDLGSTTNKISEAAERKKDAEDARKKVENKAGKNDKSGNKLQLSRDAQSLFASIIEHLKNEELRNVSDEMNRIFIDMIGASPEDNDLSLITKAELTSDYDIAVYGPSGVMLNPDQDLNGASRRAITLAFILALTKVSQVEAPNVIDTPLGMMAGFVKQSVLLQTIKEGTQVVLFLTHDEINGVESIIDQYAGIVYTLTNPAHYPKMLMNKPEVSDARVVRCECDHRNVCSICERKGVEVH